MTRSDLVQALAERFGQLGQRDAEMAVKTILSAIAQALVDGQSPARAGRCRGRRFPLKFRLSAPVRVQECGGWQARYNLAHHWGQA